MSYKPNSKEEALQEFGMEIIKALRKANPTSRKYTIEIFRDFKDRDLFRKAPSFEESPAFEYANQLDSDYLQEIGATQLYGDITESMINYLTPYRDCLETDDVKILRKIDVEKDLLGDYLVIVDWFDYAQKQRMRLKGIKNEEDSWREDAC